MATRKQSDYAESILSSSLDSRMYGGLFNRVVPYQRIPVPQPIAQGGGANAPRARPQTYEEAVLKNIICTEGKEKASSLVPYESTLMGSMISSASQSMSDLQYKSGMAIGRSLYKMHSNDRDYLFTSEGMADLVDFLGAAGYRNITYRCNDKGVEIAMNSTSKYNTGSKAHGFEAGVISGFVSASEKNYVPIYEKECMHADGDRCLFSSAKGENEAEGKAHGADMESIAGSIAEIAGDADEEPEGHLSKWYSALRMSHLLEKEYSEPLRSMFASIGRKVGRKLAEGAKRKSAKMVEGAIRRLDLGDAKITKLRPLDMKVRFDKAGSRKELVNLSIAFIRGMLEGKKGRRIRADVRMDKGSYVVRLKETAG